MDMADLDCNVTAETAEMPGYLVGFAMTVERWVDGTLVELVERDEIEAWWRATWAEHASEAERSDKVPTSIDSSNLATGDLTEDLTFSVRPGQLIP